MRALVPFLLAQWMLLIVVLMAPKLVHFGDNAADISRLPMTPLSGTDVDRQMQQIVPPEAAPIDIK